MFVTFLAVVLLHCCSSLTEAQQAGCSSLPTSTQVATLIGQNYLGFGQGLAPTIMLQTSPFGYRVVCSSSSGFRNQYRFVSIVAYYTTSDASVSPAGVPIYGQFEFECASSAWSVTSSLLDNPSKDRTALSANSAAITANITTNCSYCLKRSVSSTERVSDDTNHCSACIGCSQPLCYTSDTAIPNSGALSQTCCNFYSSDGVTCTTACNPPYFPDANRTCTLCTLNCQNGGTLRSDMCGCNCTAVSTGSTCSTCLCQNGGTCSGSTCTCPPGYSGQFCNTCTRTCPAGYYLNSSNCSCVPCTLSCQNGGALRNDICACNCSSSLVYGGTECTACQCQNGGTCSGSVCTCPPGYTGSMCENACPTSCPAGYYLTNCSCVLVCPCNGASIQCGTYATTNAGSSNVTITGTYLKCSIASNNITSFRQHAIVATSVSSQNFGPGSLVLLKQLQAISVSSADYYQCILNWQLLQHSASVALSSLGYKGLGLSYTTGHGSVESINLDVDSLSRIVSSNDYTIGGSLDSSVACPFHQLVQWLSTAASEVPSATCRDSNTGTTVATFSVNCL